ncbi:MAG: hypothetical protein HY961_07395, partial [Ignavibacteriae bacterium]|nr:hypothetical protein [Ignavibacteriota bacterium]
MNRLVAILVLTLLVGFAHTMYGQLSFTFNPLHTSGTDTLGSEIVLDGTVTNTSASSLTLMFIRAVNALPVGWESSMCLDLCYPPNI